MRWGQSRVKLDYHPAGSGFGFLHEIKVDTQADPISVEIPQDKSKWGSVVCVASSCPQDVPKTPGHAPDVTGNYLLKDPLPDLHENISQLLDRWRNVALAYGIDNLFLHMTSCGGTREQMTSLTTTTKTDRHWNTHFLTTKKQQKHEPQNYNANPEKLLNNLTVQVWNNTEISFFSMCLFLESHVLTRQQCIFLSSNPCLVRIVDAIKKEREDSRLDHAVRTLSRIPWWQKQRLRLELAVTMTTWSHTGLWGDRINAWSEKPIDVTEERKLGKMKFALGSWSKENDNDAQSIAPGTLGRRLRPSHAAS